MVMMTPQRPREDSPMAPRRNCGGAGASTKWVHRDGVIERSRGLRRATMVISQSLDRALALSAIRQIMTGPTLPRGAPTCLTRQKSIGEGSGPSLKARSKASISKNTKLSAHIRLGKSLSTGLMQENLEYVKKVGALEKGTGKPRGQGINEKRWGHALLVRR